MVSGDPDAVKKVTRRGSQNRGLFMSMIALSNTATPEQKAEARKEIGYSLTKQTGRAISKSIFDD